MPPSVRFFAGFTSSLGVRSFTRRRNFQAFCLATFAIQLAKHLGAKVATTTSAGNAELVRSLGGDVVIDYKKQKFEEVLRDYDAVLGTVPGESLEKSFQILKPKSTVMSLVGPPDAAFGRTRGKNGNNRDVRAITGVRARNSLLVISVRAQIPSIHDCPRTLCRPCCARNSSVVSPK